MFKMMREVKKLNKETMKELGITKKDIKNDESLQFKVDHIVMKKMGIVK